MASIQRLKKPLTGRISYRLQVRVKGRPPQTVHTGDVAWKGYIHHATRDDPQYEIRSDKSDHSALHKTSALRAHND